MATVERPPGRVLRLSGLPPAAGQPFAGGSQFTAYCMAGEVRARQRRDSIERANAAHRRAVGRGEDPYPTALILCQRLGVALEDLARLALALESLGREDAFSMLRDARHDALDDAFARLGEDPDALRSALRLPTAEEASGLERPLREALLEASEVVLRRWVGQWRRSAAGWNLLRRLSKALRHGAPLLSREMVLEPPGAGELGAGLSDAYERWVLLVGTEADHTATTLKTTYAMADISDRTLARARQAGIEAVALARELAADHVFRVQSQSKWALPDAAIKQVAPEHRRVLKGHARD